MDLLLGTHDARKIRNACDEQDPRLTSFRSSASSPKYMVGVSCASSRLESPCTTHTPDSTM